MAQTNAFNRKKYDSLIVWLYNTGKEGHLPEDFRKGIPYSTVSTWRNINYTAYHEIIVEVAGKILASEFLIS